MAVCLYITAAAGVFAHSHLATQAPVYVPHVSELTFSVANQSHKHTQSKHNPHNQCGHTIFPAQALVAGSLVAHPVVNVELVTVIVTALGMGGAVIPHFNQVNIFLQQLQMSRVISLSP